MRMEHISASSRLDGRSETFLSVHKREVNRALSHDTMSPAVLLKVSIGEVSPETTYNTIRSIP